MLKEEILSRRKEQRRWKVDRKLCRASIDARAALSNLFTSQASWKVYKTMVEKLGLFVSSNLSSPSSGRHFHAHPKKKREKERKRKRIRQIRQTSHRALDQAAVLLLLLLPPDAIVTTGRTTDKESEIADIQSFLVRFPKVSLLLFFFFSCVYLSMQRTVQHSSETFHENLSLHLISTKYITYSMRVSQGSVLSLRFCMSISFPNPWDLLYDPEMEKK